MKTTEQRLQESVDNRNDGLAEVRARLHREIAAERLRGRFILFTIPRPLRAAAALAVIGLGTFLLWQTTHKNCALPLCPHSAKIESAERFIASGKAVPEDFILNPERYDRICHCSPRYSGSLR
ncbi:MAG: hypothetical protein HOO88_07035 [Kiritimatiellaceae bacterium]|nr:hypothetical protein [Kiritimatiellaceae bacterium]